MNYNLRRLQLLEAVSRHGSIHGAATELEVSPSAVSHQLRRLSEEIGERLVEKSGRGVSLTATGKRLSETLSIAFGQIQHSVDAAIGHNKRVLRLAVCSSFGPGWLFGRLAGFRAGYPDIDLQLRMHGSDPELSDMVADAFVTAYPQGAGFFSLALFDEILIPVHTAVPTSDLPLITTDLDPGSFADDWNAYQKTTGVDLPQYRNRQFLQCTHYVFALELAKAALGVGLVPDFLAAADLAAGKLVRMADASVASGRRYYLCVKSARRHEGNLAALLDWFGSQLATTNLR